MNARKIKETNENLIDSDKIFNQQIDEYKSKKIDTVFNSINFNHRYTQLLDIIIINENPDQKLKNNNEESNIQKKKI
jgi:hypothetical protein